MKFNFWFSSFFIWRGFFIWPTAWGCV